MRGTRPLTGRAPCQDVRTVSLLRWDHDSTERDRDSRRVLEKDTFPDVTDFLFHEARTVARGRAGPAGDGGGRGAETVRHHGAENRLERRAGSRPDRWDR